VGVDAVVGELAFDTPLCPAHIDLWVKIGSLGERAAKGWVRVNLNLRRHERYRNNR
jgi:hypothetical protein